MKRYLVFQGSDYYPAGGWGDFQGDFESVEEALKAVDLYQGKCNWVQIIDTETKEDVYDDISFRKTHLGTISPMARICRYSDRGDCVAVIPEACLCAKEDRIAAAAEKKDENWCSEQANDCEQDEGA